MRLGLKRLLTTIFHLAAMALTAEQHAQLTTAYEKAAADGLAPPQQRAASHRSAAYFSALPGRVPAKTRTDPISLALIVDRDISQCLGDLSICSLLLARLMRSIHEAQRLNCQKDRAVRNLIGIERATSP